MCSIRQIDVKKSGYQTKNIFWTPDEQDTPGMPGGHYPVARARTEWPTANEVNTTERQMAIPSRSQAVDTSINMSREEHLARLDRQIAELDAARRRAAGSETE